MANFRFRPARVEDSPALARIQVDSYRSAFVGIMSQDYLDRFTYEEQEQDWRDLLSTESADILLVAEAQDGRVAGYALGRPGQTGVTGYDSELVALHIRRADQGRGAGRRLVAAMAGHLHDRGCRSMMLWVLSANDLAQAFYERLGGRRLEISQMTSTGAVEIAHGWPDIGRLAGRKD